MSPNLSASVVDVLLTNWDLVAKLFYAGFVGVALIAVAYHRRAVVRRFYVGAFFAGLLVVSVTAIHPFPLDDLHKFSETPADEEEIYKLYFVDEAGNELRLDRRVVPGYAQPPPPYPTVGSMFATRCSEREAEHVGRFLLARAAAYRERVADGRSAFDLVGFPRHHVEDRWTPAELERYGEFVAITAYRETIAFERESYEVRSRNSTRVLTVRAAENRSSAASYSMPEWVDCLPDG